jgi:hypothetical protein
VARIEITEVRVDGRHGGYRVAFAQREHVLAAPCRILNIDIEKSPVEQRYQRSRGRESSARMQPPIDGIARLLKRQQTDIGIFYGKHPEGCLAQQEIPLHCQIV